MKKQIIIGAALAVGFAAQVNAQPTPIYITGSTAFRSQTVSAIEALFDGAAPTNVVTRGNTDEHKAQYAILSGTIGGATHSFDVFTLWSGSEAGLAALSGTTVPDTDFNGSADTLPNDVTYFLLTSATGKSGNSPTSSETNTIAQTPDLAMADTSKAVSFSKAAAFTLFGGNSFVGVVPFTWVKCTNSAAFATWSHLVNITHYQAEVELGGAQVAAFFTGVAADTNVNVYQVGRNKGSGTRVNTLADTGYGITKLVDQWAVNPKGTTPGTISPPFVATGAVDATIASYNLEEIGNAGFESGGDVSKDLSIDGCSTAVDPITGSNGVITVAYLGLSDATANSMGTNLWLTLNGIFESDDAIAQGQYSFWGMEHLYGKPGLSGAQLTYGGSLFTAIQAQITALANGAGKHSAGVALGYMQCTKGSDTAFPTHN
jgi:hypothetical protein